jgi:hypothetical protein
VLPVPDLMLGRLLELAARGESVPGSGGLLAPALPGVELSRARRTWGVAVRMLHGLRESSLRESSRLLGGSGPGRVGRHPCGSEVVGATASWASGRQ